MEAFLSKRADILLVSHPPPPCPPSQSCHTSTCFDGIVYWADDAKWCGGLHLHTHKRAPGAQHSARQHGAGGGRRNMSRAILIMIGERDGRWSYPCGSWGGLSDGTTWCRPSCSLSGQKSRGANQSTIKRQLGHLEWNVRPLSRKRMFCRMNGDSKWWLEKKKKALVLNTLKRASSSIRGALKSKQIRCVGISLLCCT